MDTIRFKIDENLPVEVAKLLQQAGYEACTVLEQLLGGKSDLDIAEVCQQERRTLITLDTDFADIRTYPPQDYSGLVVLRLAHQDKLYILGVVASLLAKFLSEPLNRHLWIVEEGGIRIRD